MMAFRYLTGASEDLDEAIEVYDRQREGRGKRFREAVERSLVAIRQFPKAFAKYKRTRCRECLVRRFPYPIYYQELDEEVLIVAVAHGKRRPGYWLKRLK